MVRVLCAAGAVLAAGWLVSAGPVRAAAASQPSHGSAAASTSGAYYGIGCSSTTSCVVGGTSGTTGGGVVVPVNGSTGTVGTPHDVRGMSEVDAVGCPPAASSTCVAVGATSSAVEPPSGSGAWVAVDPRTASPGPAKVVPGTFDLEAVACPTAAICVAVGSAEVGSSFEGAVVTIDQSAGTMGTVRYVPQAVALTAVACTAAASCVTAGFGTVSAPVEVAWDPAAAPGTATSISSMDSVTALSCPADSRLPATCRAVGLNASGKPSVLGIVLPAGTIGSPQRVPASVSDPSLDGIACPTAAFCMAVGSGSSAAAIAPVNDGVPTTMAAVPRSAHDYLLAVECGGSAACVAVGDSTPRAGAAASAVVVVLHRSDPSANAKDGSRCPPVSGSDSSVDEFNAVADESRAGSLGGIYATIGPAPVCYDPKSNPFTSSWVMLQAAHDSPQVFVQAGISYHDGGGADHPFVEMEPWSAPGKFDDGVINVTSAIEFVGKSVSSGTFGVEAIGATTKDAQCAWVPAGKRSQYRKFQGYPPSASSPALEVETTLNGQCLWIFYLPLRTAGQLTASLLTWGDLAAELHTPASHVPGTFEHPLVFSKAHVYYTGGSATCPTMTSTCWENFASNGSGILGNPASSRAARQVYVQQVGCQAYSPAGGAAYLFLLWAKNEQGKCDPWS